MKSTLQGGTRRRQFRRRRPRRRVLPLLLAVALPVAAVAAAWFLLSDNGGVVGSAGQASVTPAAKAAPPASAPVTPGTPDAVELERPDVFAMHFKHPPKGAIVFDVHSGRVLWRRNPLEPMPIASITKLMTALLVVENTKRSDAFRITRDALHYTGSGVGLLPK